MNNDAFVTQWVLNQVKEAYADDIALVVAHTTLNMDPDQPLMSYFVPITDRGRRFARTFILEGRGYDIWGIEWERLERFASLEEYNITVLADANILYARTPEDAARFESLKQQQKANLTNPEMARKQSLIAYAAAKGLYTQLLFAKGSDIRVSAGYTLDYLARAIAFANHTYFRHAQTYQLEELEAMEAVPEGFGKRYLEVLRTADHDRRKQLCHELVALVGEFLSMEQPQPPEKNFQDLADWYAELSYTWLRIRHYAGQKDPVRVHMWAILLQNELNEVCADFGLAKMELLDAFDFDDLSKIASRANELEEAMREIITARGGSIREYPTTGDFLHEV